MKVASKTVSVILFCSIFIASCGGVAPVPTVTPTSASTALPTRTLEPSQTPTSLPTIIPTSTFQSDLQGFLLPSKGPEKDMSFYKLHPWLEHDYGYVLNSIGDIDTVEGFNVPYFKIPDYMAVFQSERLLMFPDSLEHNNRLWEILRSRPNIKVAPSLRPGQDLMSSLISNLLEQGVSVTDLKTEIEKHGLFITDLLTIPNLIGNGNDGVVLLVRTPDGSGMEGIYTIVLKDGNYQVDVVSAWEETNGPGWGYYYELHDIGDNNNNSLPEFVIQKKTGASGDPQHWSETISHVEWSQQAQKFYADIIPVFSQACDNGPCDGNWKSDTFNSKNVLITDSYWSTRGDCPDLTLQRVSVWDGQHYILGAPDVILLKSDLSPECQLAWAETAISLHDLDTSRDSIMPGWKNDLAISIVEERILNWPEHADRIWGPAGRDYFNLQLGIWLDLRGENNQAELVLMALANKPYSQKYDFAARMANLYLRTRNGQGRTKACLDLTNARVDELRKITTEPYIYINDKFLLEHWGVVNGKGKLCNVDEMLASDLKSFEISTQNSLKEWLRKSGVHVYQGVDIDLNSDGTNDYLALLDARNGGSPDVWAFLSLSDGYHAQYIYNFYSDSSLPTMKVSPIQTSSSNSIYLIAVGDQLILFQLSENLTTKILVEEFGIKDFNIIDNVYPASIIVNIDNWEGRETNTYQWDAIAQGFVLQDSIFAHSQITMEDMLYNDENYLGVISYIDDFLSKAPPEPHLIYECGVDIPGGCNYYPEWYIPYFRYLQGVAYEELGQREQAAQIYFKIWKDFPENVFGVAASLKLGPVKP